MPLQKPASVIAQIQRSGTALFESYIKECRGLSYSGKAGEAEGADSSAALSAPSFTR